MHEVWHDVGRSTRSDVHHTWKDPLERYTYYTHVPREVGEGVDARLEVDLSGTSQSAPHFASAHALSILSFWSFPNLLRGCLEGEDSATISEIA